jgi:16S rRNA (uracil1498-N3)-methyltransferase
MQSRRAHVPEIDDVTPLAALAPRPGLVVADRAGSHPDDLDPPGSGEWTVVVGPEGGLASDELRALGAVPRVRLGAHVLRSATAPIAAVAVLLARADAPRGP